MYAAHYGWPQAIPGVEKLLPYYYQFMEWVVNLANEKIFHLYKTNLTYGVGDSSAGWVQLCLFLLIALIGCIIWSLLDSGRTNYNRLAFWFRNFLRYTLILHCIGYGLNKIFLFQMPYPTISQLATPFGDFSPMRLSWLTMGSSSQYQFFAGAIEAFAGILLLFRGTATFGTLVALGVFTNVMIMNLGYDIIVKVLSIHLVIICLVLLSFEYKRIKALFFNKAMAAGTIYNVSFPKRWMRVVSYILKISFVVIIILLPLKQYYTWLKEDKVPKPEGPIKSGIYEVKTFVLNNHTLPYAYSDSQRWKDVIFDNNGDGSIGTTDTMFRQRYGRGYFKYKVDSNMQTLSVIKRTFDFKSVPLGKLHFELQDSNVVILSGKLGEDSVYAVLVKTNRHFQLTEKQFHWLSNNAR